MVKTTNQISNLYLLFGKVKGNDGLNHNYPIKMPSHALFEYQRKPMTNSVDVTPKERGVDLGL